MPSVLYKEVPYCTATRPKSTSHNGVSFTRRRGRACNYMDARAGALRSGRRARSHGEHLPPLKVEAAQNTTSVAINSPPRCVLAIRAPDRHTDQPEIAPATLTTILISGRGITKAPLHCSSVVCFCSSGVRPPVALSTQSALGETETSHALTSLGRNVCTAQQPPSLAHGFL